MILDAPLAAPIRTSRLRILVRLGDELIADSERARLIRTLDAERPVVYFLPPEDVELSRLQRGPGVVASALGVLSRWQILDRRGDSVDEAWRLEQAMAPAETVRGHFTFAMRSVQLDLGLPVRRALADFAAFL